MSGFARPHTPWRVPQRFWDLYKTDDIKLAAHKLPPQDMPGVAWMAHSFWNATTGDVWPLDVSTPLPDSVARTARHAYYASVSWLDFQLGRVLDELASLGEEVAQQTITVLHGDHGWQLGEHNSWHKYTNFELGVRVPLVIRAPMYAASLGKVSAGLAELVDVYPTIAELAGVPLLVPLRGGEHVDGVSLLPFFEDPARTTFDTRAAPTPGTRNKTLAFSQYPHTDKGALVPASACPFFRQGACHAAPLQAGQLSAAAASLHDAGRVRTMNSTATSTSSEATLHSHSHRQGGGSGTWMGFSVRDGSWRYTAWMPFNGSRADWTAVEATTSTGTRPAVLQELYNHSYKVPGTTSMDALDDVRNLAYTPQHAQLAAHYFDIVREFFDVLVPPTAPTTPPPPPPAGCASWCKSNSKSWKQKCGFVGCSLCPQCSDSR